MMGGGKGGSGGQGYNYFGSLAILVCMGPVKRINSISNGDTPIFTGPLDSGSADSDGKSTIATTIGSMDFYWGTSAQNPNGLLESLEIDLGSGAVSVPMPAYRNLCYVVLSDAAFGQQVAPPTLKFDLETVTSGLAISAHSIEGDAVIPEAVYQYLTSSLFGHGLSAAYIDSASFIAAAETVITEGLGASPDIDNSEDARTLLGRMLSHVDGFLYFHHGKLRMRLIRKENTSGAPAVTEADLLEEPLPNNKLFAETWNETRIGFRDRANKWEDTVETYSDPANATIVNGNVSNEISFPYFTRRQPAKLMAKLLGIRGGVPPFYWELQLKPQWRDTEPGSLIKLSYDKLGIVNRVCRVTEVRRGHPGRPSVGLSVVEEVTRDTSHDYVPPEDQFTTPAFLDAQGGSAFALLSTTPRLSWLPTALKDGKADGMLVAMERPDATTSGARVFSTWNPGSQTYQQVAAAAAFPAKFQLLAWWKIRSGNWMLRVQADTAHDMTRLNNLAAERSDWFAVVGRRDYKSVGSPVNVHRETACWLSRAVSGRYDFLNDSTVTVEVIGGAFGTPDLLLETLADNGLYPCLHVYFGRRTDFVIVPSDSMQFERNAGNAADGSDTDEKRYVKACITNWKGAQIPDDVTAVTFDRNDATMCPQGTYSREWGARSPNGAEIFDTQSGLTALLQTAPDYAVIADLDLALGHAISGTASAYELLLIEHIDNTLGAMTAAQQTFYNE